MSIDTILSSELSGSLGISHEKTKKIIREKGVPNTGVGLKMVEGRKQRVVLVNIDDFNSAISGSGTSMSRKKPTKKKKVTNK